MTGRIFVFLYGTASYAVFFGTCLYLVGFLDNRVVPKSIDSGEATRFIPALAINVLLILLFALQHSFMARRGFKRRWTHFVPEPVERSTYVLFSSLAADLLFRQWRPMPGLVWSIDNPAADFVAAALFWTGWLLIVTGSFLINHFDLFGLRQVYLHLKGRRYTETAFKTPSLYKLVRHPLMLGFIIAFWSASHMTTGHLVFAAGMTAYIVIGLRFEERDLLQMHGSVYEEYRQNVPMLLPLRKKMRTTRSARGEEDT